MGGARRSGRIGKGIGILLFGTDTSGHVFSEETRTVVLSRHGAGIVSRHKLAADEVLTLRLLGTSAEAGVRLVGEMGEETSGYTYGVTFLNADLDFWELKFPPPPQWHNDPDCALECNLCHDRQMVHQSEIEADVYALNRRIFRFCTRCGTSTVWQQADGEGVTSTEGPVPPTLLPSVSPALANLVVPAPTGSPLSRAPYSSDSNLALAEEEAVVEVAVHESVQSGALPRSAAPASADRTSNRRGALRSRVNFTARVRHADLGDEIAESDNVSIGGFSFRSRKFYPLDSLIEVAVPYSPGWDPIFVQACIKHVEELPGGALFRYGAAYTKPAKNSRKS